MGDLTRIRLIFTPGAAPPTIFGYGLRDDLGLTLASAESETSASGRWSRTC